MPPVHHMFTTDDGIVMGCAPGHFESYFLTDYGLSHAFHFYLFTPDWEYCALLVIGHNELVYYPDPLSFLQFCDLWMLVCI